MLGESGLSKDKTATADTYFTILLVFNSLSLAWSRTGNTNAYCINFKKIFTLLVHSVNRVLLIRLLGVRTVYR